MNNKRVLYYTPNIEDIKVQQFFQIDFNIIRDNGYEVIITDKKADLFKWWKYDIQFVYFYTFGFFRAFPAFLFRKKIYFTGGIDSLNKETETYKRYFIQKIFFLLCYFIASKCIIVSDNDWNNIIKAYHGMLLKKLVLSYHVVNVEKFLSNNRVKKKRFLSICWQGSILNIKRKGLENSLILFKYLLGQPEFSDYEYVIIGKHGEGTKYLRDLIHNYNLDGHVTLTGEISESEKISLLVYSEYYFQLSHYEGFGLAALEALAAGNLVIHSNAGGLKYVVGDYGVVVDSNSSDWCNIAYQSIINFKRSKLIEAQSVVQEKYNYDRRKQEFYEIFCGGK